MHPAQCTLVIEVLSVVEAKAYRGKLRWPHRIEGHSRKQHSQRYVFLFYIEPVDAFFGVGAEKLLTKKLYGGSCRS